MKINKQIVKDFVLNIIASALPIAILQLYVLPVIAKRTTTEYYGYILTIVAIVNVVALVFGNVLNNVRLIMNEEYKKRKLVGDYNVILMILGSINVIVMFIIMLFYKNHYSIVSFILISVYSLIYMLQSYLSVEYRINLDFKKILINAILLAVGYIIGVQIFKFTKIWQIVYIVGVGTSLIYQIITTRLLTEPFRKTTLLKQTTKKTVILLLTALLANVMIYLDRIILYPILGGEKVTIFYVASLLGKMISMVATPMATVLLSYYSKINKLSLKTFWKINTITLVCLIIIFPLGIIVGKPIIGMLYPDVINIAMPYINLASIAALISVVAVMVQPAILKFCATKWQLFIQIFYIGCYVIGLMLFKSTLDLMEFCYISIVSNFVKLLLMFIIGTLSLRKKCTDAI